MAADQFGDRAGMPLYANLARAFRSRLLLDRGRASRREAVALAAKAAEDASRAGQHRVARLVAPILEG